MSAAPGMSIMRPILVAALLAVSLVPAAGAKTLCTVVADAATGKVLKQDGTCDERVTAASTFKIAISLMGYDAGFLKDEHHPALPFRKGYPDWVPSWRRTTDPTAWIANSVVWYSQQVTQALGEDRFRRYVTAFHYGNEDVSGDPGKHDGLTRAWLSSSLKISPLEEVAFLEKLVEGRLPVSPQCHGDDPSDHRGRCAAGRVGRARQDRQRLPDGGRRQQGRGPRLWLVRRLGDEERPHPRLRPSRPGREPEERPCRLAGARGTHARAARHARRSLECRVDPLDGFIQNALASWQIERTVRRRP